MEKIKILQFAEKYIQAFESPDYNPYDLEEAFCPGLKDLGFESNYALFLKNHPELKEHNAHEDAVWSRAFQNEDDLQALGNIILYLMRDEIRGAWTMHSVDYKWYIIPLQRLAELCK